MQCTAIIFDFNGTMFLDTDKNEIAWQKVIQKYSGKTLTPEDFQKHLHGRPNPDIVRSFINPDLTNDEAKPYCVEKEDCYLQLCREDKAGLHLTEGLVAYLDYLQKLQVPINIATGADRRNLDFYLENLNLAKWFDPEKIVYSDGKRAGKPAPDIYLEAAQRINVQPEQCLVYEDAYLGVMSATNAKVGRIIGLVEKGTADKLSPLSQVYAIIHDFTDITRLEGFRKENA